MATFVKILLALSILVFTALEPSTCKANSSITNIQSDRMSQPTAPKCVRYLDEVRQQLGSTIPPINDSTMTDNYFNISRALYPSIDLPALYVKVTVQFLNDYQNGTKTFDDKKIKFTWSKACSYVSVKYISLNAMTIFSLATIFPQRRETELIVTVLPFCKDSPYAKDEETRTNSWRYIVSTIEDIAVNPKISDPRINTVACVVKGHEGDGPGIEYTSGRKNIEWDFCWFVLSASILASIVIWLYAHCWIKDAMEKYASIIGDNVRPNELEKRIRIFAGTVLKMTFVFVILTLVISLACLIIDHPYKFKVYDYFVAYSIILALIVIFGCLWNCCKWCSDMKNVNCVCIYKAGSYLLFPCLFMTIHHLLWVMCGIISEPYWATPIFLMECLLGFSIMYSFFLYEKDVVVDGNIKEGKRYVAIHLFFTVVAFVLILLVVVFVGHGHIVNVTTAGVIEVMITITLMWLVKNSGIQLKSFTSRRNNEWGGNTANELESRGEFQYVTGKLVGN